MKRISIIIPIYNVEPYVERCLRSLEDQDIPKDDYEIICINDGSPDISREVVMRLQTEFDNIVLIDQKNQGVSCARNNGIDKACGRYLLFIDPDDYVDTNSFSRILETADGQRAEVSFLGFTFLNENGKIRTRILNEDHRSHIFEGMGAYFLARSDGRTDPDRMWAILIKRKFMNQNNLYYLADVPYLEDGELIARILCLAERCIFDGYSFYQRTTRKGSATNSKLFQSEKATKGFLLAASNLKKFQQEQNLNEKQKEFMNQPILKFALLAVNSSIGWRLNERFLETIKTLKDLDIKRINLKGCHQPYRLYWTAYNLSPYIGAIALILYPRVNRIYHLLLKR